MIVLAVIAITATSPIACGDDDDETTTGSGGAAGEAVAPPPSRAFSGLSAALEAQGLDDADEVAQDGDKTTTVGTVVFQAPTQADADFFAAAYEGD